MSTRQSMLNGQRNTAFLEAWDDSKHVKEDCEKPLNSEQKTVCVCLSVV